MILDEIVEDKKKRLTCHKKNVSETEIRRAAESVEKVPHRFFDALKKKQISMIDEYQFYQAKAIGAAAVLLIAAILDDAQMRDFYQLAKELSLDSLVEVHNEEEMERALKLDAEIIGVNNRNLKDFTIELDTTRRLSKMVPEEKVFVAESGIITDEDVRFLKQCKVDAFLIGRALMEAEHPAEVAAHWKELA